ncbi:MAG: xylose isomerase [Gammaproteobacteria bacterium]|nr:xylose isomerase [Gammaproteobacteria bacterium]MYF67424.1 xylose isomerase [Gammaproteobacteria bacterium]MYK36857.1 xylose isomerase [Gammaproteobacteria bacterium]
MNRSVFIGDREYFPGIARIQYEGPESDNPLAFKTYDPSRSVGGKTMEEHLRFAVCYWHTFCATGGDPFGPGTRVHPWAEKGDPMDRSRERVDAAFEFFTKLNVPFWCFHDFDLASEGGSVADSEKNLEQMVGMARERQDATGMKLLWGTANVFSHPRYMNGASTNPDFAVVAYAASQVKAAIDATVELGGENYVFWGGREGYACLQNTDTRRELEHMAMFLSKARDYGRSVGFKGTFLVEPKPMEPMKHQYDFDALTVIGFLRQHGLAGDFKLNVEANHATLAGHAFAHDLRMAADAGLLGSIDANRGDPQNGWDTDQFAMDLYDCVHAMMVVLEYGGLGSGGLNFDAKVRRESTDLEDMFIGHIGAMDAFARGLLVADRVLADPRMSELRYGRYRSFDLGDGKRFEDGELSLGDLRDIAAANGEPRQRSGKQELVENLINDCIVTAC